MTLEKALQHALGEFMSEEGLTWYRFDPKCRTYLNCKETLGVGKQVAHDIVTKAIAPKTIRPIKNLLAKIEEKHPHLVEGFIINRHGVGYHKKEVLSSGICDNCNNCGFLHCGDGRSEPTTEHYVCKVFNFEIEPLPLEERVLECKHFERKR